jgi:hypothetical protein
MKKNLIIISLIICFFGNFSSAQDVILHVNTRWEECSIQLDPSLTQDEWHRFTKEAGLVTYFRPLADARSMGVGRFEISVLQWNTRIDETAGAWNNTFVHPREDHWLIGGEQLPFPGLTLRAGLTNKIDAGVFWGMRPGANYGVFGGQIQYNFVNDSVKNWAASSRIGFNNLYGPDDLNLTVYGLDLLASKTLKLFSKVSLSPYAGVSTYLSHSHEKTDAVNLNDENVLGVQSMVGSAVQISVIRLGVEYNMAKVNSLSYKIGANFRIKSKKN